MKTKYGEIKSIWDLFEETGKKWVANPRADKGLQVIIKTVKCKLCGDSFEIQSREGAVLNDGGRDKLKDHIELHKIVSLLK